MRSGGLLLGAALATGLVAGAAVAACDDDYDDHCSPCSPCSPPPCHTVSSCQPTQTRARPVWMPDSASTVCTLAHCSAPIGVGSRHHCRACGALVCGNCSRERLILRHLGYHHPERVCDRCVAQFRQPLVPQPVVYPVYQQQQPAVQQFYQAVPPMAYGYGAPQPAPPAYGYGAAAPPPYGASPPYNAPPPAYHSPNQDPYALAYAKPSAPPM